MGLEIVWARGPVGATLHAFRSIRARWWEPCCGRPQLRRKARPLAVGDGPRCGTCAAWVARAEGSST